MPELILYGQNQFGPKNIQANLPIVRASGFTTVIFGMFHIGNEVEKKPGMKEGDIIFNGDEPLVVQDGKAFPKDRDAIHWPGTVEQLKGAGSTVNKIYASFGGAAGATQDFATIKTIYEKGANGRKNTFDGTALKSNLLRFRGLFSNIDGIDMDCEETYDLESFVAFCQLLREMYFHITFCPYCDPTPPGPGEQPPYPFHKANFWTNALKKIHDSDPDAVKWWNLQCYEGGLGQKPAVWADAIAEVLGRSVRDFDGFIIPGDGVIYRYIGPTKSWWQGDCPNEMTGLFSTFAKQPCVGGGFIWDLDLIAAIPGELEKYPKDPPCPDDPSNKLTLADYLAAMKKGLGL